MKSPTILEPRFVSDALRRLSRARVKVFGAESHGFVLNAPLSFRVVDEFERRHSIQLPQDYRDFITGIGDGGAGPAYGLFPLGLRDPGVGEELEPWKEGDGFVGILSRPFPFDEPWNDTKDMPQEDLLPGEEPEYERRMNAFEERYWSAELVNGALPICHLGCAIRMWLVVTGKEASHVWRDGRSEYTGLSPVLLKDSSRATFSSWYAEWLEECLSRV